MRHQQRSHRKERTADVDLRRPSQRPARLTATVRGDRATITAFWKKLVIAGALGCALFGATLGRSDAFLDKTRFAGHLGVAYPHRTSTLVKGGAALLFAVHEVKVAQKIAHNSPDPLLQKLEGSVGALGGTFTTVGAAMKGGHFNPADLAGLAKSTESIGSQSAAAGTPIKDVPVAIPGQ